MPEKQLGMTLIEVLIALAIIAISLTAIIKAASQNIRGTDYLQNKAIALWVGEEVMSEVQLGLLPLDDRQANETTVVNMLGQDWHVNAVEKTTGNPRIKQIRVRVYAREPEDEETSPLIDLDGYRYHASN